MHTAGAHCSRLVKVFRKSSRARHVLHQKQEALGILNHKLIQDVETRRNSTFDMVEHVMKQQVPTSATLVEHK